MDILTVNQFILTVFGFMQRINITKFCKNSHERVLQMHFTTLTEGRCKQIPMIHFVLMKFVEYIILKPNGGGKK